MKITKTAVEWLFDRIIEEWGLEIEERDIAILEQAKEMEVDQIMIAFEDGVQDGSEAMIGISDGYINSEDYYNKTYKNENNNRHQG